MGLFELNACAIGIELANLMKNDRAVLLPRLYDEFKALCMLNSTAFPSLDISDMPTSRWLLSKLHYYFDNTLQVHCSHKHYGTILMHKECDVMKALSSALNARTSASNQRLGAQLLTSAVCTQEPCPPSHSTSSGEPTEQQIVMVANSLNHKLHNQIKQVNQQFQNYDSLPENSLEQFLSISDPLILKFLKVLTQTVRQSRRSLFAEDKLRSGLEIKTARLLYALSVLQFITNNTCNMPFHVPLTEAILCHRGTQKLVTFLNRIGAVYLSETFVKRWSS